MISEFLWVNFWLPVLAIIGMMSIVALAFALFRKKPN